MQYTNVLKLTCLLVAIASLNACKQKTMEGSLEQWKAELMETEGDFAEMARQKGIDTAFLTYAAEDAVLLRNNKLVIGKEALVTYFDQPSSFNEASLTWEPDFVDVSTSGDLGYTYGQYVFTYKDSTGVEQEHKGIFHTVWKRQEDNTWKFVWD